MKPYDSQEKRSHYELYRVISKVVMVPDKNNINKLNQYLTEKWGHFMHLHDSVM